MTARAQPRELDRLLALGAVDVIPKPFDPMGLAARLRGCVPTVDPFEALRCSFILRADNDAVELCRLEALLATDTVPQPTLADIGFIAHRLAGSGGIFGFAELSEAASILDETVLAENSNATLVNVADAIRRLIVTIERKQE